MKFKNIKTGNIISATEEFIVTLPDANDYEVFVHDVGTSFEELKALKLIEVKTKADEYYNKYLSQFPLSEQETFKQRGSEAIAYKSDNTSLTPYIDASLPVNSTAEARAIEINSVYEKSLYIATLSGIARDARTQVENCTTIEELNSIQ